MSLIAPGQESSVAAIASNKIHRSASRELLQHQEQEQQGQVAVHHSASTSQSLADLSDKHFAISAAEVDAARSDYQGNWVTDSSNAFQQHYRKIIEHVGPEDDVNEAEPNNCESVFGPGICRKDTEFAEYDQLLEQSRNVLRFARQIRRDKGFIPDHTLLLLVTESEELTEDLFMLVRLSFKPLDASSVRFHWQCKTEGRACLTVEDSQPVFNTLCSLVLQFARRNRGAVLDDQKLFFKTAKYKAVSLSQIIVDLTSVQAAGELSIPDRSRRAAAADDDESSNSSAEDMANICNLKVLRQAAGKHKGRGRGHEKKKGRGRGAGREKTEGKKKGKEVAGSKKRHLPLTNSEPVKRQKADDEAADELGRAGQMERNLMSEWADVVNEQLGPAPKQPEASASSKPGPSPPAASATSAVAQSGQPSPIPVQSYTHPWRDSKGYCWVFSQETKKPYHLGWVP